MSEYQWISLGGWCKVKMQFKIFNIQNDKTMPFDFIKSSTKGLIKCIQTDFKCFLENPIYREPRLSETAITSQHFAWFYHDVSKREIQEKIQRQIQRFLEKLQSTQQTIFVRWCLEPNWENELNDLVIFQRIVEEKYPNLPFIILFLIPDQEKIQYYKSKTNKLFIFLYKYIDQKEFQEVIDFVKENVLFTTTPTSTASSQILPITDEWYTCSNFPVVLDYYTYRPPNK